MSNRRVLAISSDLDHLRRLVATLERAGAVVDAVRSVEAIAGRVIPHHHVVCAVSADQGRALAALVPRLRPRAQVVVVTPQATHAELLGYLGDAHVNHVVVGADAEDGLCVTAQKLMTGDIFGVEKYLPAGTPVQYARIHDGEGRGRAIDSVLAFADEARLRRPVRGAVAQVCEELLMNALYDAPVDDAGRHVFADVERHARRAMSTPRPVSIRYAATETGFAVAVRDRYGRRPQRTILGYIDKCLTPPDPVDPKTHGAGQEASQVASAVASCVVNVAHGVATEVVCTFDRGANSPLRLFGVFVHPGQADQLLTGPVPTTARGQALGDRHDG